MLFNSPIFLFLFLPLVLCFYYVVPSRFRNYVICFSSLFFYAWGEQEFVFLIVASAVLDFCCGKLIQNGYKKTGLISSLLFNLSILIYFKYSGFFISNFKQFFQISPHVFNYFLDIVLPLGISFYTFQTMSYTIDVYRGKVKASNNIIEFIAYVTMFPQLIAGPIVRYSDIEKSLKKRVLNFDLFSEGVKRFIIGLAKKTIIANNCAFLVDGIFDLPASESSALITWLGAIAYTFQIYYDFSGYSDMAIGLGKMLGFNFPENFNFPYISKSIREFWKRWHITLSSWFKDYLYISLGGNRKGGIITYRNLLIVFFVTGLWHGASWNFIVWGFFHGILLIIERLGLNKVLENSRPLVSRLYTLFFIVISWVIFRSETLEYALQYINVMFDFTSKTNWDYLLFYLTKEVQLVLVCAVVFSMPINEYLKRQFCHSSSQMYKVGYQITKVVVLCILLLISTMYVATDAYNPFIYFRF